MNDAAPRPVAMIRGDRTLPPGYDHPHASEAARRLAERGQILRVQVGSAVHGTAIGGQDDRDEMGICLEPPEFVTSVAWVPAGVRAEAAAHEGSEGADGSVGQPGTVPFEQYQRHTVSDRPGGLANRSGAGDLDVVIYSARKWCRLALAGNPTVLLVLFVPDEEVVVRDTVGCELVANAHRFVSRLAGDGSGATWPRSGRRWPSRRRGRTGPSWSTRTATTSSSPCTRYDWRAGGRPAADRWHHPADRRAGAVRAASDPPG